MKKALSFKDVLLVPQFSSIESRSSVSTKVKIINSNGDKYLFSNPMIVANMKTLIGYDMLLANAKSKSLCYMHRFTTVEDQLNTLRKVKKVVKDAYKYIGVSIGVKNDDKYNIKSFYDEGIRHVCLDIAHGDSQMCLDMISYIKKKFPNILLCAGNVATYEGAVRLWKAGANLVKVGVGSGCLAAGTRVLMANGTYKNIENIQIGDKVINMNGDPVKVTNVFSTGIKNVNRVVNNSFYEDTFVTPDHKFYVGDLNSISNISAHGYSFNLKRNTKDKQSKFKWKSICELNKYCSLLPNKINFEMNKTFSDTIIIDKNTCNLHPSYNLGYIFGTFLGDGCAFYSKYKNSYIGNVTWYFNYDEDHIANKLVESIYNVFGKKAHINKNEKRKLNIVKLYDKNIGKYLNNWNKKDKKSLPQYLLVNNKDYLNGIYDGLIDSDGSIDKKNNRKTLTNTSKSIIEIFNIINKILFGYFPNNGKRSKSIGNLLSCNESNLKQGYYSRTIKRPERRVVNNYDIIKILKNEQTNIQTEVFDITVDCDTHSFIANNMIVHNSICSTRIQTGNGVPQLHAIMEVARAKQHLGEGKYFISDGGCSTPGDVSKALCFADMVMAGNMFAGSVDTPSEELNINGKTLKSYCGSSTHKETHVEGYVGGVEIKSSYENILEKIIQGVKSCCSYQGVNNLNDLKKYPQFVEITSAGIIESGAHDIYTK